MILLPPVSTEHGVWTSPSAPSILTPALRYQLSSVRYAEGRPGGRPSNVDAEPSTV